MVGKISRTSLTTRKYCGVRATSPLSRRRPLSAGAPCPVNPNPFNPKPRHRQPQIPAPQGAERHLNRRDIFKQARTAALAEWRQLAA